jgi:RNA polymerase sigma-70 factor (ECF subfamily)
VSFERLFERHHRNVLAYCLRRARIPADAEDATAETFSIAWRRRRELPPEALPWLYGTARRVLANQRRGGSRWTGLLDRLRSLPAQQAPGRTTAGPALDALALLREADREILRLLAWEELSHAEIAASLGITVNAVAIRIHRARQRYATAYRSLGGERSKESSSSRTSPPVTGSNAGRLGNEET